MLRSTKIANELAVIERKLQETSNQTLKDALKKKQARLKDELNDSKKSTPQLAKKLLAEKQKVKSLSKIDFNDLVRRLSKKPEYSFLKTMNKSTVRTDLERRAKPVGWRFKGRGNYDKPTQLEIKKGKKSGLVYRENRPIRSDVSHVVRLGEGGVVINGISINIGDKGTYGRSKEEITITSITPKIINFTTSQGKKKGIYRDAFVKSYVPNGSNVVEAKQNIDQLKKVNAVERKNTVDYKRIVKLIKGANNPKNQQIFYSSYSNSIQISSGMRGAAQGQLTGSNLVNFFRQPIGSSKEILELFKEATKNPVKTKNKIESLAPKKIYVDINELGYGNEVIVKYLPRYTDAEKMQHGGSIEIGDRVKASKEYGGKSGTVVDKRGSFVVVEYSNGDSDSYHESDLIKKMSHGGSILTEEQEEAFNEWKNDGNVAEAGKDIYTTQDSQWSNRIQGIDNLKKYFYNEFLKN